MKGLLVKDFCLLFLRKQTMLIFVLVCLVTGFTTDGSFVVGYMAFLSVIIAMSTISYDDADNGMPFLMTLPIERKTYAYSKYILGVIFAGGAWLLSVLLMLLINTVKGQPLELLENIGNAAAFLPVSLLLLDLMIPLQLKYGAEKSRIVMLLFFGGFTAFAFVIGKTVGSSVPAEKVLNMLDSVPAAAYLIGILVVCVVLTWVSLHASRRIMEKKSF